ncbi:MAG: hypothetical protein HXX81_06930 [Campylobacterales bacterium]|nr:hypothetical protein [Campylobacterales bacterium]
MKKVYLFIICAIFYQGCSSTNQEVSKESIKPTFKLEDVEPTITQNSKEIVELKKIMFKKDRLIDELVKSNFAIQKEMADIRKDVEAIAENRSLSQTNSQEYYKNKKSEYVAPQKQPPKPKTTTTTENKSEDTKIELKSGYEYFDASTYQLTQNSDIFANDGAKVGHWIRGFKFTSKSKKDGYLKVSGYFVNKKWTQAEDDIFVPLEYVNKLD